jgi:hypothetical protein
MRRALVTCTLLAWSSMTQLGAQVATEVASDPRSLIPHEIFATHPVLEAPAGEPRELQPLSDYIWLSAAAVDQRGLVALSAPLRKFIESKLDEVGASERCLDLDVIVTPSKAHWIHDANQMVRGAKTIFEGEVRGLLGGFYRDVPGFMLSIEIDSVLVDEPGRLTELENESILAFYPGPGIFPVLGKSACIRNARFPRTPTLGDRIMVFATRAAADPGGQPVTLSDENVIIQRQGGEVELSQKLRLDDTLSRMRSVESIRAEVLRRRTER